MRYLVLGAVMLAFFVSCNKDSFDSVPAIKFKSITRTFNSNNADPTQSPILTIEVTDKEGDFGFTDGSDSSYIFVKNLTIAPFKTDSFKFPAALNKAATKNFKANVDVALAGDGSAGSGVLASSTGIPRPFTDTLYFEVYVKDFAKHKSNVIKTDDPLYYVSP